MTNFISLLLLLVCIQLYAQESIKTEATHEQKSVDLDLTQNNIYKRVLQLKDKNFPEVINALGEINLDIQKFIQNEKEACSQLHATQLISKNKLKKEQKRPLTRKEKEYCKLLIVNFQIKLNELIHEIRIDKLKDVHAQQIKQVQDQYRARILELEKTANKLK